LTPDRWRPQLQPKPEIRGLRPAPRDNPADRISCRGAGCRPAATASSRKAQVSAADSVAITAIAMWWPRSRRMWLKKSRISGRPSEIGVTVAIGSGWRSEGGNLALTEFHPSYLPLRQGLSRRILSPGCSQPVAALSWPRRCEIWLRNAGLREGFPSRWRERRG
jgi:hypothetical protein